MTSEVDAKPATEKVRVAGKGRSKSFIFKDGNTVAWWAAKAEKALEGGEKFFIGQEEVGSDHIVTSGVTITIGTEAANGA